VTNDPAAFLILADESAAWKIAGLPQLDRLALALNELAESIALDAKISVVIFWRPDISSASRWLPRHPKLTRVHLSESLKAVESGAQIIDTRLFVHREAFPQFLGTHSLPRIEEAVAESMDEWSKLREQFRTSLDLKRPGPAQQHWHYLADPADISGCDKAFLSRMGKTQDGLVSRFMNRPISRSITRRLLQHDVDPNVWTILMLALPVAAFLLLVRGDYVGILSGAALFQLYSIVDGCDGEIARAKYLESERGARIDDLCDLGGSILFVVGLGLGLFRSRASAYALEGFICAAVILVNEWLLHRTKQESPAEPDGLNQALYPRHRRLVAQSGLSFLGENSLWWIIQFTKRDVAIFVFLLLAIIDRPEWILHLWLSVSVVMLILSAKTHRDRSVTELGS
jgi:hypothetical protein